MVLADLGADVLRVERPEKAPPAEAIAVHDTLAAYDYQSRGRLSAGIDLKHPDGVALVRRLARTPTCSSRGSARAWPSGSGIGPDGCATKPAAGLRADDRAGARTGRSPTSRATTSPTSRCAGCSPTSVGAASRPPSPLNLLADYGGGGLLLALGICAALVERATSGEGQVVDAAMVDGAPLLMAPIFGAMASGFWSDDRGTNLLDSGAPFYDVYECRDGGYVAVAAMEPQFWAALLDGLGLDRRRHAARPERPGAVARAARPADGRRSPPGPVTSGPAHFEHRGACVAPVLTMGEAQAHPHIGPGHVRGGGGCGPAAARRRGSAGPTARSPSRRSSRRPTPTRCWATGA